MPTRPRGPVLTTVAVPAPPTRNDPTIPSPTGGGVVGRTKVSDDNNPLPRDRLIFDYDYFNNGTLAGRGVDVSRFSAGFEAAFFDQRFSVEMRVPFAATLNSSSPTGPLGDSGEVTGVGSSHRSEFGDLNVTLKALLVRGEFWNISTGVGMAFPTAQSTRVFSGP